MYVRYWGEAEARKGAPSGTRDKGGGEATWAAEARRQEAAPSRAIG